MHATAAAPIYNDFVICFQVFPTSSFTPPFLPCTATQKSPWFTSDLLWTDEAEISRQAKPLKIGKMGPLNINGGRHERMRKL